MRLMFAFRWHFCIQHRVFFNYVLKLYENAYFLPKLAKFSMIVISYYFDFIISTLFFQSVERTHYVRSMIFSTVS